MAVGYRTDTYRSAITPLQSGEVFLYVNDAVIALPGLTGHFYKRNHGTAKVRITPTPPK